MLTPRLSGNVTQNIPTVHISQGHVGMFMNFNNTFVFLRVWHMTKKYDLILDSNIQCSICYENYKINEEVKKLICDHMFHDVCITPWLRRVSFFLLHKICK